MPGFVGTGSVKFHSNVVYMQRFFGCQVANSARYLGARIHSNGRCDLEVSMRTEGAKRAYY